ncbi:MAG: DUF3987 domain-containing protein [Gammaproteobacteria bacterium]|nr:DUF3987 domain-containing protein [Gammaproteobacteria bacterium]
MNENVHVLSPSSPLKDWAIYYASLSYPIIPLYEPNIKGACSCRKTACSSAGKHPRVKNGLKDATTDLAVIKDWWTKWPNANIGLITGQSSNLVVVDIDLKNDGFLSLEQLEKLHGALTAPKVRSGGNGLHFYFSMNEYVDIRNKVNLLPGIDIRAECGYIVAPPSRHVSGQLYIWESFLEDIPTIPDWLLKLLAPSPLNAFEFNHRQGGNLITPGSRNSFLASIAGALLKKQIDSLYIEKILASVNEKLCVPALDASEITSIAQSISKYQSNDITWDTLIDLPTPSFDVPEMHEALIPNSLREWIVDIAHRMQVPCEFIAIPAIVGISSIIGRKVRIYPKQNDNWVVVPNLWGAIVSRPGTFKSPAMAAALQPLEDIIAKSNAQFTKELNDWAIEKTIKEATFEAMKDQMMRSLKKDNLEEVDLLKERLKKLQEEILLKAPSCKRLKTNDATVEKLVELLLDNPNGLLVIRDELSGWIMSLNKQGKEENRPFYLESWNGYGSYTVDRIGRGTVHIPAICLSILGGIQPDKLERLITNSLDSNDDGLLQRFQLLIYPEIKGKWENHDISPNIEAQKKVSELIQSLHHFEPKEDLEFKGLRFDEQAQELFNSWREGLEIELRSGTIENLHYEGHISKYRSLIPSLALIFELLENNSRSTTVSAQSTRLAIEWGNYLLEHAKKIYKVSSYPHFKSIQIFHKKLLLGQIRDGDSIRSIIRHHWEGLNTTELVEKVIDFFCNLHWIQVITMPSSGRPIRLIKVHPDIRSSLS